MVQPFPFSAKTLLVTFLVLAGLTFLVHTGEWSFTGSAAHGIPQANPAGASAGARAQPGMVAPAGFQAGRNFFRFTVGEVIEGEGTPCQLAYVTIEGKERVVTNCPESNRCIPQGKSVAEVLAGLRGKGMTDAAKQVETTLRQVFPKPRTAQPQARAGGVRHEGQGGGSTGTDSGGVRRGGKQGAPAGVPRVGQAGQQGQQQGGNEEFADLMMCDCLDKEKFDQERFENMVGLPPGESNLGDFRKLPKGGPGMSRFMDPRVMAGGAKAVGHTGDFGTVSVDELTRDVEDRIAKMRANNDPAVRAAEQRVKDLEQKRADARQNYVDAKNALVNARRRAADSPGGGSIGQEINNLNKAKDDLAKQEGAAAASQRMNARADLEAARQQAEAKAKQDMETKKKGVAGHCAPQDDACIDHATRQYLKSLLNEMNEYLPENAKIDVDTVMGQLQQKRIMPLDYWARPKENLAGGAPPGIPREQAGSYTTLTKCDIRAGEEVGRPGYEGEVSCTCPGNGKPVINMCPGKGEERFGGGSPLYCSDGTDPAHYTDPSREGAGALPVAPSDGAGGGWAD